MPSPRLDRTGVSSLSPPNWNGPRLPPPLSFPVPQIRSNSPPTLAPRNGTLALELGERGRSRSASAPPRAASASRPPPSADAALDAQAGDERLVGVEERGGVEVERDAAAAARVGRS